MKIFSSSDSRTTKVKKNIVFSILLKGGSILVNLLLVPVTLNYLNPYEFGVWLTLSSILMWINYFDVGLGNGLRNKLAEALSLNDKTLARIYISTTFFLLSFIVIVICFLFSIVQNWLNWYKILNESSGNIHDLNLLVSAIFYIFCVSFVLKIIGSIYQALQFSVINDLLKFFSNVISLLVIVILTHTSQGDLWKIAITYSCVPLFVYLIAILVTFIVRYPYLRPTLSTIKIKYAHDLLGIGFQFFVIQISSLIIFSTSNIIITRLFGAEYVTYYTIAYRYLSVITMVFGIIISPLWSAITDAYVKNDYTWIKRIMSTIKNIWLLLVLLVVLMVLLSNIAYKIWIGTNITISPFLTILMGVYVMILNWINIYVNFINGVGKLKIEMINSVVWSILYIPAAVFLGRKFGINGIAIVMSLTCFPGCILFPLQYKKIINNTASGIWNK